MKLNEPAKKATKRAVKRPASRAKVTELFPDADPSTTENAPPGPDPAKSLPAAKKTLKRPVPKQSTVAPTKAFKPDFSKLVPLAEKQDFIRAVLYGDHGVGKTTSALSLANRGLVVAVDPENSVRRQALQKQGINTDNLLLWPQWKYDDLEQLFVTVKEKLEGEPGSIFAVVFDTATALASFWLEDAVTDSLAKPSMQKKHPDRTKWDVFQDDYGVLTEQVRALICRKFYTLPCHVVVTAHARRGENENGLIRVGPALSPAAAGALMTYSDWVFRLDREEAKDGTVSRGLDTQPRGQIEAKERFGVFEGRLFDTSLLELLELWEAGNG